MRRSKTSLLKREEKRPGTRHKTEPVPQYGYDIEYTVIFVSFAANHHCSNLTFTSSLSIIVIFVFSQFNGLFVILNLVLTRRLVEFEVYLNENGFSHQTNS